MGDSIPAYFRDRRLRIPALVVIALVFAVLAVSTVFISPVQAVGYSSEETAFVQMLNDYRASNGLGTLLVSDAASLACDRHNADMAKYGFFSHTTAGSDWFAPGASPWDRMAACGYDYNTTMGENIAAGRTFATAAAVFAGWKNSSGHNANMLNPKYKVVGVSLVQMNGSEYGCYWTTDFGGYVDPSSHSLGSGPTTTTLEPAATFPDVGSNTLYAQQIRYLADRSVVSGFSNGTFGPNQKVTRQQFAKMIVLALGYEVSPLTACGFKDVVALPGSADPLYPVCYIAACAKAGITVGTTVDTFSPYDQITRAQLITMVVRAAGLSDPPAGYRPPFDYFSPVHYQWARKAAYAGLLDGLAGLGSGFDFWAPASRGEACLLLANLMRR